MKNHLQGLWIDKFVLACSFVGIELICGLLIILRGLLIARDLIFEICSCFHFVNLPFIHHRSHFLITLITLTITIIFIIIINFLFAIIHLLIINFVILISLTNY